MSKPSSTGTAGAQAQATARSMSESAWFDQAIRVGLVAYGIVHILIGWLGLELAFGDREGAPSQQGAFHILAQQPGGEVLLWVTGLGFIILTLWQLTKAAWGHTKDDGVKRAYKSLGSAAKGVIYAVIGYSAIETATAGSSSSSEVSLTRRLLDLPGGQLIVIGIGVVIGIIGIVQVKRGVTTWFEKRLEPGALEGSSGTIVKRLGQVGYVAKGIAFGVLGGIFIWAGATYEPKEAGGLDTALRTLLDESIGPWLLVGVAAGFVAFGLYAFAWAWYADTSTS